MQEIGMMRVVYFRDLSTEGSLGERKLRDAILGISRKYKLKVDFLSVVIPDIERDFRSAIKVNEGRTVELESFNESFLEEVLLSEMAGGIHFANPASGRSIGQEIEA